MRTSKRVVVLGLASVVAVALSANALGGQGTTKNARTKRIRIVTVDIEAFDNLAYGAHP